MIYGTFACIIQIPDMHENGGARTHAKEVGFYFLRFAMCGQICKSIILARSPCAKLFRTAETQRRLDHTGIGESGVTSPYGPKAPL